MYCTAIVPNSLAVCAGRGYLSRCSSISSILHFQDPLILFSNLAKPLCSLLAGFPFDSRNQVIYQVTFTFKLLFPEMALVAFRRSCAALRTAHRGSGLQVSRLPTTCIAVCLRSISYQIAHFHLHISIANHFFMPPGFIADASPLPRLPTADQGPATSSKPASDAFLGLVTALHLRAHRLPSS